MDVPSERPPLRADGLAQTNGREWAHFAPLHQGTEISVNAARCKESNEKFAEIVARVVGQPLQATVSELN